MVPSFGGRSRTGIGVSRATSRDSELSCAVRYAAWLSAVAVTAAILAVTTQNSLVSYKPPTTPAMSTSSASWQTGGETWFVRSKTPFAPARETIVAKDQPPAPAPARAVVAMLEQLPSAVTRKEQPPAAAPKPASVTGGGSYGLASYYSESAERTASGERFNARELTAAHRTLPFGTRVRVTNVKTGRTVTVRINDRGPFVRGRIIDVSRSAAESLGMVGAGVAKVKLDVVQ
jgi:peptidoglycan lytic transglycosylase